MSVPAAQGFSDPVGQGIHDVAVVPSAPDQRIVAGAAIQRIVARAPLQGIVGAGAGEHIRARVAGDREAIPHGGGVDVKVGDNSGATHPGGVPITTVRPPSPGW